MNVTIGGVEFSGKAGIIALILLVTAIGVVLLVPDVRSVILGAIFDFAR